MVAGILENMHIVERFGKMLALKNTLKISLSRHILYPVTL
jgi:hypothetical protein